tara:strand:+ start:52395 stop:52787 length:393 start_codon:yes stop_codon:yes gene_type:complete
MKALLFLSIMTLGLSVNANAAFNDFECEFTTRDQKSVELNVESQFGGGMRTVNMSVRDDDGTDTFRYYVSTRYDRSFKKIEYFGGGIRLEIDLWPDTNPRYGRTYRAQYSSWDLGSNSNYFNILCRYTRI